MAILKLHFARSRNKGPNIVIYVSKSRNKKPPFLFPLRNGIDNKDLERKLIVESFQKEEKKNFLRDKKRCIVTK